MLPASPNSPLVVSSSARRGTAGGGATGGRPRPGRRSPAPGRAADRAKPHAFTLVEVVVAIGVFALTIVTVVGLMSPLTKSVADVSGHDRAAQLGDAIQTELIRLRDAGGGGAAGLDAVATVITQNPPMLLVASADGTRVVREADAVDKATSTGPLAIPVADRAFLIEINLYPEKSADGLVNPLHYTSGSAFLAVTATIAWPYQIPDGAGGAQTSDPTQRSTLLLNFALPP